MGFLTRNTKGWISELLYRHFPGSSIHERFEKRKADELCAAKEDQADLRRYAQTYWSADGAKAAVHVDARHRRGFWSEFPGRNNRTCALIGGRRKHGALIEAGDVIADEARGTEAVIQNFHLNLPAVGVAGK